MLSIGRKASFSVDCVVVSIQGLWRIWFRSELSGWRISSLEFAQSGFTWISGSVVWNIVWDSSSSLLFYILISSLSSSLLISWSCSFVSQCRNDVSSQAFFICRWRVSYLAPLFFFSFRAVLETDCNRWKEWAVLFGLSFYPGKYFYSFGYFMYCLLAVCDMMLWAFLSLSLMFIISRAFIHTHIDSQQLSSLWYWTLLSILGSLCLCDLLLKKMATLSSFSFLWFVLSFLGHDGCFSCFFCEISYEAILCCGEWYSGNQNYFGWGHYAKISRRVDVGR